MSKMFSLTSPSAEDNPWKGMKYSLISVLVIESDRRKYLLLAHYGSSK